MVAGPLPGTVVAGPLPDTVVAGAVAPINNIPAVLVMYLWVSGSSGCWTFT